MTEKYATVCPHCKRALYITLTFSSEEGQKPKKPDDEYLPGGDVEEALFDYREVLDFTPTEGKLLIQSTTWLDTDDWRSVNKIVKAHGGTWIPGGKESHWEVPT